MSELKTFELTLAGDKYVVPAFTLGQLRRMSKFTDTMSQADAGFAILAMALERASPPIPDPDEMQITQAELKEALGKVMQSSGMETSLSGEAQPQAEAAA